MKMKFPNTKFFAISVSLISVYLFLFYTTHEVWSSWKATSSVKLPYVVVHIDLKGSPPKMDFLHYLLPMLKDSGVNALMMEYEDMFPYEGRLVNLSAKNCYTRAQLKDFITSAAVLEIEIIPLIQTFGHLEYALKLAEFKQLREEPGYPDSICPSNGRSRDMVMEMLEQVVKFHNDVTYLKHIHVGCDEVYQINKCDLCLSRGLSNAALYVDYIRYISNVITKLSPETTILIWDDMVRKMSPLKWEKIDCFNNIEPVYWDYRQEFEVSHVSLNQYHKKFKNIWIASAFKGADGPTASIPNLNNRVENHFTWMKLLQGYKMAGETKRFDFKGIILTGWSRYGHMRPLCELLPVSIPSLLLNLRMIQRFKASAFDRFLKLERFFNLYVAGRDKYLDCDIDLGNVFLDFSCNFEGDALYSDVINYINVMNNTYAYINNDLTLLTADVYYSKRNYVDLYSLQDKITYCNMTLTRIKELEERIALSMKKYYEGFVIKEFVEYKFYDITKQLTHIMQVLQKMAISKRVWETGQAKTNQFNTVSN